MAWNHLRVIPLTVKHTNLQTNNLKIGYHCRVSSRRNCILTFFFIIIIDTIWERIRCSFFHRELDISKHLNALQKLVANFFIGKIERFVREKDNRRRWKKMKSKRGWRKKKRKERQGDGVRVGGRVNWCTAGHNKLRYSTNQEETIVDSCWLPLSTNVRHFFFFILTITSTSIESSLV